MSGGGGHRVIDRDHGQRADGVALLLDRVHLGDFFFERAAGELDAEDAGFEGAVLFTKTGGATVFALVVALDAVVGLVEGAGEIRARVGELEAFAVTPVLARKLQLHEPVGLHFFRRHEVVHVELVRRLEEDAGAVFRFAFGRERGPRGIKRGKPERFGGGGFGLEPAVDVRGETSFGERLEEKGFEFSGYGCAVDCGRLLGGISGEGFSLNEAALDRIERRQFVVARLEGGQFRLDAEQGADEVFRVGRQFDDQFGTGLCRQRRLIRSRGEKPVTQRGIRFRQLIQKNAVESGQACVAGKVVKVEPKRQSEGAVVPRHVWIFHLCYLRCWLVRADAEKSPTYSVADGCCQDLRRAALLSCRRRTDFQSLGRPNA